MPGVWRRLTNAELKQLPLSKPSSGWRIDLDVGAVKYDGIDHLFIAVDAAFPNSQPRVLAPQAGSDFRWPHVEEKGLLCLKSTRLSVAPAQRILQHIAWAHELLNYGDVQCQQEFEREFSAYWDHRSSDKSKLPMFFSMVAPGGKSREIVYFNDFTSNRIVVADSKSQLISWLRNSGKNPSDKDIQSSWVLRLSRPLIPKDYPETGQDILKALPISVVSKILIPGQRCPLLFEAKTATGPAFAGVLLNGATERALTKGFRGLARVPFQNILKSFTARDIQRCPITRVDGPWVHGRGHDQSYPEMRTRTIAIIGCGALGSAMARLLAQSGVGRLLLVDHDILKPPNVARHVLGIQSVMANKAKAMAKLLHADFPHIDVKPFPQRFEWMNRLDLEELSKVDLIVSAGIDFDGDMSIDSWRRGLSMPPAHLCAWTEAFAVVGHAVLLYGKDSLKDGFDESEQPIFRLTDWPVESGAMVVEAGCGNAFQPHGAVELQSTVALAARLAVDVLLGKIPTSCRRVWQGDMESVSASGGFVRGNAPASRTVGEFGWP